MWFTVHHSRPTSATVHAVRVTEPDVPQPIDVTWLGHATADVSIAGVRFLTDPVLRTRLAHLRRRCPPAVLAPGSIDAVLISHLHHDHLDLSSLRRLPAAPVIVPRGAGRLVSRSGRSEIVEVAPGDVIEVGAARVLVVHADHSGRRSLSRAHGPALGFLIEGAGRRVYFPGDTDLFDDMTSFGPLDLALLPIWGWGQHLGPGHLNPRTAADAAAVLGAASVLPIHWGTFSPLGMSRGRAEWLDSPAVDFAAALPSTAPGSRLVLLEPGGASQI
jgi:L-ascorbate metabolism protein UlaG (beta-lactamase superfamily)